MPSTEKDVRETIQNFKIETGRTQRIRVPSLLESTKLYEVKGFNHSAYIISTPEARDIACYPSVVGDALDTKCIQLGVELVKAMYSLRDFNENIVLANILRAGPGYKIGEVLKSFSKFVQISIRPRYKEPSYRAHDGTIVRELEIVHEDFQNLEQVAGKEIILIKPDTEASGSTSKISLEKIFEECKKREIKIKEVVLYGFISESGLRFLEQIFIQNKIKLSSFSIGNITSLAHNNYDMLLYGIDESYFASSGAIRNLGSITAEDILWDYLPHYFPGMDQPGDFSARQKALFTGIEIQNGNIQTHLENSLNLLSRLKSLSEGKEWYKDWHAEIAELHSKLIKERLEKS